MKLNTIRLIEIALFVSLWSTSTYAIDLSVSNAGITPDPIVASSMFTISVDINNHGTPPAKTPEDAQFIAVSISGYDPANVTGLVSNSAGWSCAVNVSSVDCDRVFTTGEFPPDTTKMFQVTLSTGVVVNIPDTFTITATDKSGLTEDNVADNDAMVTTTAGEPPDLGFVNGVTSTLLETDDGDSGPFIVNYRVKNNGGDALTGASLSILYNDVDFSLSFPGPAPVGWNCNQSTASWNCFITGNFPNGAIADFQFDLSVALGVGNYPNVIDANITDSSGREGASTLFDNDVSTGVNVVLLTTDLELTKFAKDGPAAANLITSSPVGANFFYQIHVNNLSVTAGTNVVVTDPLPAGIRFINDRSSGSWGCSADPFINEFSSQGVSCSHPSIPASTPNFSEIIVLEVVGLTTGVKSNIAVVSSIEADSNPLNNDNISSPSIINITNPEINPDVVVNKTIVSGTMVGNLGILEAVQGNQVVYKILGVNTISGSVNATDVLIMDTLPPGVTYVSHNTLGPNFNCPAFDTGNNKLTCTASSLPPTTAENGVEIVVEVTGEVGLTVVNSASITASNDSNTSNNTVTALSFEIISGALPDVDLTMTKEAQDTNGMSLTSVNLGDSFNYKLFIENFGVNNAPVGSVEVQDTLPAEVRFVLPFASPVNWTCNIVGGNHLSCINDVVIVASGPVQGIEIPVVAQLAGNAVNNTASVGIVAPPVVQDTDAGNNLGSISININSVMGGELSITKMVFGGVLVDSISGATNEFTINDTVTYKLTVSNNSAEVTIEDLLVSDELPSNLSFLSATATQDLVCSYDSANHKVTCGNGANTPFLPGEIADIEIKATATTAGLGIVNVANVSSFVQTDNINSNSAIIDIVAGVSETTLFVSKEALFAGSPVTSVSKGTAFTYRVNVTNTGNSDALNVKIIDDMPQGVIVNTAVGAAWLCNNVGQQYTCELSESLAPGTNTMVEFAVVDNSAEGVDQLQNNVEVTADNATLKSASNSINLTNAALNLNVSQNPDPITENTAFDLKIDVVNTGTEELRDTEVVNTLPAGFSYAVVQNKVSACIENGLVMTCALNGPVAVGAIESIIIPVVSIAVVDPNVIYTNMTTVAGSNLAGSTTVNTVINVISTGIINTDISISKTASVDEVSVNGEFSYTLIVTNNSSDIATDVIVTDNLPAALTLNSINASTWVCNGTDSLTCSLAALAANESSTIIINVSAPPQAGVINNIAQVSSNEEDENPSNNSSEASVNVIENTATADLSMLKRASVDSLDSGEQLTWRVTVTNNGPDIAQNVTIRDQLPVGFELSSIIKGNDVSCTTLDTEINCETPTVNVLESKTITIIGTVTLEEGVIENTAEVSAGTSDIDLANNTHMASVTVNAAQMPGADLSISINNENEVNQGDTIEFQLVMVNNGPNKATTPTVSITITGLIDNIVVNSGNAWICEVLDLTVDCQFNTAQMPSGHSSNILVTVQTTQVVVDAEDLMLNATISSTTNDPETVNNSATSQVGVNGTPTESEILNAMQSALDGTGNQQVNRAIQNVSSYCERKFFEALEGLCNDIFEAALAGDGETIRTFMEQITPNEIIGQSTSVAEIATAQFRNVGARLSQLRGGAGSGFSTAGLNARYGNSNIPLGMLAYLNQTDDEKDGLGNSLDDFISPWGFFVNGTISMGERDATGRELGFDFDSYGITAGIDYRLSAKKVVGIAIGYANFDSEIGDSAELKSTGITLTGYGSFYVNDNFYIDSRISYSKPEFDQSRNIDFTVAERHIQRTAVGKTTANQYSVAMSAGYSFYKKAWNITPNASFNYVKTTIDGFSETGAGGFDFIYSDQDIESLVWSAGIKISRAISLKKGVITPQFDFDYNYESKNDGNDIEARFISAPFDEIFIIETDSPDRTYGSAGLGLVYITSNGKQTYINYRSILGLRGFSRGTFNVGARFEF